MPTKGTPVGGFRTKLARALARITELRQEVAALEQLADAREHAIAVFQRDAELARKEADEHRRRRLDIEQEMRLSRPAAYPGTRRRRK